MVHAQGVVPLGRIEGQVAQEQAPDEWTQPFDLIGDPVEGQGFQLASVNLLAGFRQAVQDSNCMIVGVKAARVEELLLSDENYNPQNGRLGQLRLHEYFRSSLGYRLIVAMVPFL